MVGEAGVDQTAQLDFVMVASNFGPPSSVHVVLDTQDPPEGLNGALVVREGRSGLPKLAHEVVVIQAASRGPPLHSLTVVVERHISPGCGVVVGLGVISGRERVDDGPKSGGIPVGFGEQ